MQKIVEGDQSDEQYACVKASDLELGVRVGYYLVKALSIVKTLPPP